MKRAAAHRLLATLVVVASCTGWMVGCRGTTDVAAPEEPTTTLQVSSLQARIELASTTVATGSTTRAEVVVDNPSAESVWAVSCLSPFMAYLEGPGVAQDDWTWPACAEGFEFPSGESRWPIDVVARTGTGGCLVVSSPDREERGQPCLVGTGDPLPAGSYSVAVRAPGWLTSLPQSGNPYDTPSRLGDIPLPAPVAIELR